MLYFLITLFTFLAVCRFLFRIVTVSGESMTPFFQNGERFLMLRLFWKVSVGQFVVVQMDKKLKDRLLLKQVRAIAGETVRLSVNDFKVIDKPLLQEDEVQEWYIPENHLFIQGTNKNSFDSTIFGPIPMTDVLGIFVCRLAFCGKA